MATNKRDPRKVSVTDEPTLVTDLRTRRQVLISIPAEAAETVYFHRRATDDLGDPIAFEDCFPIAPGKDFTSESGDPIYAIVETGPIDIWVWEEE
ncbi:MAG: hypothetical protein ABL984_11930 [Pyrinomonadaceae bacterium]